ncbi:hypothetical protein [Pseudomonas sp. RGM2987]|uniref:hypothetical protein n=1 Tax=Pseudomonas sp. RGM2987 TaxID=2930090 RepID=UPI001FD722C3|nr:hypothetical protein [Pseudomonas sp. RGM2987]MCJ8206806.1 hypothetical protein [Pseudomonas sp. RGM2987]
MRANDRTHIAAPGSKGSFQKELEVAMPGEVGSGDIYVVSTLDQATAIFNPNFRK